MSSYKVGDRVTLHDHGRTWHGAVTKIHKDAGVSVEWDSGSVEYLDPAELNPAPLRRDDDPKSEGHHERVSALWDSRPGK